MGKAARRALVARTTAGERFDLGLQLLESAVRARIEDVALPDGLSAQERNRLLVRHLRGAEA